jgi:ant
VNKSLYIPFEGARLIAAEYDGQVYVAMRPIVEALQMSWPTQRNKLQKNVKKYGCILMNTPTSSEMQEMLYIPLKKLNGWLFSINAAKVRADLRTLPIARGSRLSFLMSCPSPAPDWCGDFFGGSI